MSVQREKQKRKTLTQKYKNNIQLIQIIQKKSVEYMREEKTAIKEYLHYEEKYGQGIVASIKQHLDNFISQHGQK